MTPQTPDSERTILIIHQHKDTLREYRRVLEKRGFSLSFARNGEEGIAQAYSLIPDLIIAEIILPEVNGYQVCRLLKNDPATQKIPILLVSREDERMDKFWGFKAGADAFIGHGEIEARLTGQVNMLLELYGHLDSQEKTRLRESRGQDVYNISTRLNQILDKSLIESTLMNEFRNLSDLIHDKNLLNYMLFSLLETILEYDVAAIFYNDRNTEPRLVTLNVAEDKSISTETLDVARNEFFDWLREKAPNDKNFQQVKSEVIGAVNEDAPPNAFATRHFREFMLDNQIIGAFGLFSSGNMRYDKIFPIELIENEIKLLMKLRNLYSRAEILAITDGLTGLFNYRHFMMVLEREFKRAKRYELDLTLAIIDIDHFKQFNDTWGHPVGDEILKKLAAQVSENFRNIDFIARYGGEEVVVILPETTLENAQKACERFRRNVEEASSSWLETPLKTTVSIGVATLNPEMENASTLIKKADEALYQAKNKGRNQVELSVG